MKRLMVSVPTAPYGSYHQELVWWLMSVQVQSACRDLAHSIADGLPTSQLKARAQVRDMGEDAGIGWVAEQAERQWVDARTKKHLWASMIPDGWSVTFCPVPGSPLAANRNNQAKKFLFDIDWDCDDLLNTDYDAVLLVDADNVPSAQDLHHLLEDIERDDVDVVGGVYCVESQRADGVQPLIYEMSDDPGGGFRFASREVVTKLVGQRGLIPLENGGLPTGCLLITRDVFKRLHAARRPWFKDKLRDGSFENYELRDLLDKHKDDPEALAKALDEEVEERHQRDFRLMYHGNWAIGEDIWFCRMCHDLGIRMWVDTRVFLGHIKLHDNKNEFRRYAGLAPKAFKSGVQAVDPNMTPKQVKSLYRAEMQRKSVVTEAENDLLRKRREMVAVKE